MRPRQKGYLESLCIPNGVRVASLLLVIFVVAIALTGWSDWANSAAGISIAGVADSRAQSWTVARGDSTAWKILPDRLECTVTRPGSHWIISKSPLLGDFVIEASLGPAFQKAEGLIFSASADLSNGYLLTPGLSTRLYQISASELKLITTWALGYGTLDNVHKVRILKKGASYSISMEGRVLDTITNPGWDTAVTAYPDEPDGGHWGFAFASEGMHVVSNVQAFNIPSAEFFPNNPIIAQGPKGAWDQLDAFSSAVLKYGDNYYLYYAADHSYFPPGVYTETLHRIGVARSPDLRNWTKFERNPILGPPLEGDQISFFDLDPSYRTATLHGGGGIVRLPNGNFGLTFNVQANVQWQGVWLAEAPTPLGPFRKSQPGPILGLGGPTDFDGEHIHLHGVLQKPGGAYAMLYTAFNSRYQKGRPGDRAGLATSKDMIHWRKYAGNPVFEPGEPGTWDSLHVRPHTVARLGVWYYMFYEGAHWDNRDRWPDAVGMARSKDLIHWERYPYNPIIPAAAGKVYGNVAHIQPAAIVSEDTLYVYYGCLEAGRRFAACGAKIPTSILQKWGAP